MAIGDTDAQIAAKQQSEAINKLSSSMVGSSSSDADKKQVLVKRRPRGNLYGKHLWGSNPKDSGDLDYVRKHGEELIHKVLTEDDHWKYVSLKQVHDVRLYTPVATPEDDHLHASSAAVATAVGTSASTRSLSSTSSSSAKERQSATRSLPGRCDFRAMTRLPGSIDTVMEILAADEDREAYWTAINTQKGLRANNMFGSRRLNSDAPFPRWSQRYMATRFTKYSTKSVDFCFAEYSKFAPVTKEGEPRRGFVYRRSVDESLFEMDAIKARMAKYDDECERMYIQDWLYEVSETQERDVCKVVLTCQVYFSGDYSRSLRTEFHEFTTDIMVQLRKVLTKHWREQQGEAVDEPESLGDAATKLLNNAFKIVKPGQSRYCAVCSSTFTLLRKRYTCRTCCVSMCSKCSKTSPHKGVATSGHGSHDKHASNKECILCYQFSDETTDSRSSSGGGIGGSTRRRHFVTSSMSSEYDDDSDDNSSLTSSSRSILGNEYYTRKFNASKDLKPHTTAASPATATATTTTTTTTTTAAAAAAHAKTPPRVVRKVRNDSSDSTASSKSVPEAGVVLFSDLDALTLSGRVRGTRPAATASANGKRPVRTVSEDNVLHAKDSIKEEASEFDDLDNFTLKFK